MDNMTSRGVQTEIGREWRGLLGILLGRIPVHL